MKFLSPFSLFIIAFIVFPIHQTEAHFLQISGSVGAVLHIDPDDDPIAKKTSAFYFEFKDKDKKFIAQECACNISITDLSSNSETKIAQKDIGYIQNSTLIFKYVFPAKGIYRIHMDGNPAHAGDFSPFALTYDIRVDRESTTGETEAAGHLLHYVLFGGAIILTIGVVIRDKRREMKV